MCFAGVLSKANYKCVQYTRIYHTGLLLSVLLPDEGSDSQKAFQVQLDIEYAYLTQEKSPGCQSNPNPFPPPTMCCPTFVCLLLLTRYSSKRGCKRQELIGEGAENRHLSLLLFSALWISHGCNSVHSIEPSLVLHREGGGKKKEVREGWWGIAESETGWEDNGKQMEEKSGRWMAWKLERVFLLHENCGSAKKP